MMKISRVFYSIILLGYFFNANANDWKHLDSQGYLDKQLSCQLKVHELQWSHTIWPEHNKSPKPLFSNRFDIKILKQNIEETLVSEQLLTEHYSTTISSEMLQKELNRIVRNTKNPTRLKQYFSLFDNNANSIVECLVRPIVVKNLWRKNTNATKVYSDQKNLLVVPETTEFDYIIPKFHNDKELLTKNTLSQESDIWLTMNSADAPQARYYHTAVWTGSKMIVWGGQNSSNNELQNGGLYDPVFDSWESTAITGSTPSARLGHTAIWTGTYMVIWGGHDGTDVVNNGGRYDPSVNSWSDAGTSNLTARQLHTAVWTGSEMIVWGGYGGGYLNSGGIYNPTTNTWSATNTTSAPIGRYDFTAIWSGTKMVVWGGFNAGNLDSGGVYDLVNNTWSPTATANAPAARNRHTAVWTGSEMIIWSGNFLNNGRIYDVGTNVWRTMSETNAPTAGQWHSAVWTGSEMIVWGGFSYLDTGGRYVVDGNWTATGSNNVPSGRDRHTGVWAGNSMIIWGGDTLMGRTNTGAIYFPDELIFANGFE